MRSSTRYKHDDINRVFTRRNSVCTFVRCAQPLNFCQRLSQQRVCGSELALTTRQRDAIRVADLECHLQCIVASRSSARFDWLVTVEIFSVLSGNTTCMHVKDRLADRFRVYVTPITRMYLHLDFA